MSYQIATNLPVKLEPYINPQDARTLAVQMSPNLTIAKGTVLGQITATKLWKAYASGNVDGSQAAKAISIYDFVTDANGNVILGPSGAVSDPLHATQQTAMVYIGGNFLISELVGYDATALSTIGGKVMGLGTGTQWIHIP